MDLWHLFRWAHIAAGVMAFLVAPVALASAKGGRTHRRWGYVYLGGMTFATLSATVLAATTGNTFFTFVGLFSFYLGFSGYRAVGKRAGPRWFDWRAGGLVGVAMLGMLVYGLSGVTGGDWFFLPLVVFGLFGLFVVGRDVWQMARPPSDRHAWLYGHMIGMVSSAAAAMSAVSVTNFRFLPPAPRILWPASVAIPLLVIWLMRYKRKLKAGRPLAELVTLRSTGAHPPAGWR